MLRVSKLADYATLIMVCLAEQPERSLSAKAVALVTHVQVPTVSKLLKQLANGGLLASTRGVSGGYMLARRAETISLADIVGVVEGQHGLTECSEASGLCALEDACVARSRWRLVSRLVHDTLAGVSLAEFAKVEK
jgi:FeS assembly SUF system regulator